MSVRHGSVVALLALALPAGAHAKEPVPAQPNGCPSPGGQGAPCATEADCALHPYATLCVEHTAGDPFSRRCEIPCETLSGAVMSMNRSACALGETCREAKATPGRKAYICRPSAFRVDLNLLDEAVARHIEVDAEQPVFSPSLCSLQANLATLLDQDGDKDYDIFDLDLVVLAFLEQPACDLVSQTCDSPDLVPCATDAECGKGLYCDAARHLCQRDCGLIAAREEAFEPFDRGCKGALKVCNYGRGRCEKVDPTATSCQVDSQCPPAAYCLVGRCASMCYGSAACPGTNWYCSQSNRCRALPHPSADSAFIFDPKDYAVRFSRDTLKLDAVATQDASALVVMDLVSKKQVTAQPSVTFGYRLELTYGWKQDARCLQPFVDCGDSEALSAGETKAACEARQQECIVDDTEQWIQLPSPFGTVSAIGTPSIAVALDTAVADALSPGTYTAKLRAIFDNGDSDTVAITFVKASPSGEYQGSLSVTYKGQNNLLNGLRPLTFGMRLKVEDTLASWDQLMAAENVKGNADDVVDVTKGLVVRGLLHGAGALAFTRGGALTTAEDEIPFVGLYSTDLGRIRLLGIIEVHEDFCLTATGDDCGAAPNALAVKNLFGRTVRRTVEFVGPFVPAQALFHGMYRERISGLVPTGDITLEGGFRMSQIYADASALKATGALLDPAAGGVVFPTKADVAKRLEARISADCASGDETDPGSPAFARTQFASKSQFDAYLAQARRAGAPTESSPLGKTTIFPALRQFTGVIDEALAALGADTTTTGQQKQLNIYDFVSSRLLPCDPTDPSPPPVCIDEPAVRCGLALYQKALNEGWVDVDQLKGVSEKPVLGEQDVFCIDTIPTPGCPPEPGGAKALFAVQEHNGFWRDLGQILKFDADRSLSDAFLVLFRNDFDPFSQGAALSYKQSKLRAALSRYDQLVASVAGPEAATVLFKLFGAAFKQHGGEWTGLIHTILADRMSALAELVDLEARVFGSGSSSDFVFAHHLMQQEYLLQVYLLALEAQWQDAQFATSGEAGAVFEAGQKVLNQLDPKRNSLGVQPGVVFFESTSAALNGKNQTLSNWEYYRSLLVGDGVTTGVIDDVQSKIDGAVKDLQASMADLDALEGKLLAGKLTLKDRLAALCGDPNPGGTATTGTSPADTCQALRKKYLDYEAWETVRDCAINPAKAEKKGLTCPDGAAVECADYSNTLDAGANNCAQVVKTFSDATGAINGTGTGGGGEPPRCVLDKDESWVTVSGAQRPCVGGAVGRLLQEKVLVDLQRRSVVTRLSALLKKLSARIAWMEAGAVAGEEVAAKAELLSALSMAIEAGMGIGDTISEGLTDLTEMGECMVILGLAVGTDCPMTAAVGAGKFIKDNLWGFVKVGLTTAKSAFDGALDDLDGQLSDDLATLQTELELMELGRGVDDLVDEYAVLTQSSLNLSLEVEDQRYQAQVAVDGYDAELASVADHLVGRESGFVLRGDLQVRQASESFREVLQLGYRMVMAFVHHYNLSPAESTLLVTRAQSLVTVGDADDLVALLDSMQQSYCGKEAIDCDWGDTSNVKVLRFSLREQLFAHLHDSDDGPSGKVVTAGQKFHNTITQPPYLRRRIRGVLPTDQIELPFSVAVTLMQNQGKVPTWLINPLECNQHLAAGEWESVAPWAEGTVAVNLVGKNLTGKAQVASYELVRGGLDFMRSCHPESVPGEIGTQPVLDYPIRRHLVSYAPQSTQAQQESVPAFVTGSQSFDACLSATETLPADTLGCWATFARDRTLAAPDYKLVIPLHVGGGATTTAWITGEGLPETQRPVIEDIVLYFRYTSRPIQEP